MRGGQKIHLPISAFQEDISIFQERIFRFDPYPLPLLRRSFGPDYGRKPTMIFLDAAINPRFLECVEVFVDFSCFSSFPMIHLQRTVKISFRAALKSFLPLFPLFHNLSSLLGYLLAVNWFDLYDRKSYKCAGYWKRLLRKGLFLPFQPSQSHLFFVQLRKLLNICSTARVTNSRWLCTEYM